ncbi:tetratricopeptide repeat protein [Candidatus Manganitrophus noduliformans]|nr:tetratricopeptide repeat protein [Candidatus Manganitrophus noduliformans]
MKKVIVLSIALMFLTTACGTTSKIFNGGGGQPQAAAPGNLPETVQDEFNEGVDAYNEEKYVNAQQHFENVTKINPDIPEAHLNLALALYRQGKTQQANQHFEKAQQLLQKEFGMGGGQPEMGQQDTSGQQ